MRNNNDIRSLVALFAYSCCINPIEIRMEDFADASATVFKMDRSCVWVVDNTASKEGWLSFCYDYHY